MIRLKLVRRILWALAGIGLALCACGSVANEETQADSPGSRATPDTGAGTTATSGPDPTATGGSAAPSSPVFHSGEARIDEPTRARMASSWHPGCPVAIQDLRLLTVDYWGFDRGVHRGEMVVNASVSGDVRQIFGKLFEARFPIRRMRLVDEYGGDDGRSMAADNTSAFNCRSATGHPGVWSEHSYGWAIDINPVENPYVDGGFVAPASGSRYVDRALDPRGMVHPADAVVRAFRAAGWEWGGAWNSVRDYQHFSLTGR